MAEKAHPANREYVGSGIFRNDGGIFYLIGNYDRFWIFSVKLLRLIRRRYEWKTIPTSIGYLLPLADADRYSVIAIQA